jgi:hypothetical protein
LDGGLTWSEAQTDPWLTTPKEPTCNPETETCAMLCTGGDDKCLLRDVTFAQGLFVAVGWKIFTSTDGLAWTERTVANQQWMGGVEFGNDVWLAIGGCGEFLSSADGLTWAKAGNATTGCGHLRDLAFGNGYFVATGAYNGGDLAGTPIALRATGAGDFAALDVPDLSNDVDFYDGEFLSASRTEAARHYTSVHGASWTPVEQPLPPRPVGGVYLRVKSKRIERSEDGLEWTAVTEELPGNVQAFAAGDVEL